MNEIPKTQSRKIRVVLVNFFCFACSFRELQSSLMSGVDSESTVTTSYDPTGKILLLILVLISGLNSWAIAGDLANPIISSSKNTAESQTSEEQTQTVHCDVSFKSLTLIDNGRWAKGG